MKTTNLQWDTFHLNAKGQTGARKADRKL